MNPGVWGQLRQHSETFPPKRRERRKKRERKEGRKEKKRKAS